MNFYLAVALYVVATVLMRYAPLAATDLVTVTLRAVLVVRFDYPNLAIHDSAADA